MPQVKQEKTDAPEEWTSGTGFPTSALQPGYPSKVSEAVGVLALPYRSSVNKTIVSGGSGTVNSDGVLMRTVLLNYLACLAGAFLSIGG